MKILVIGGASASGSAIVAHLGQNNNVDIIDPNVGNLYGNIAATQKESAQPRTVEFSEGQLKTPDQAKEKGYALIISVTKSFSVNGELGQLIEKVNTNKCPVLTLDTEVYPKIASKKKSTH